jgi:hypothetical protein
MSRSTGSRMVAAGVLAAAVAVSLCWMVRAAAAGGRGTQDRSSNMPGAATALYDAIVDKYIAAQWDTIGESLGKTRDIATMTKDQQADVTYIRQAVNEGRPAWWNQVKQGKKTQLVARLWQRALTVNWDPSLDPGTVKMQQGGGQTTFSACWTAADMDSTAQAEHGFTKGDLAYVNIWSSLELMEMYGSLSMARAANLDQGQKVKLNRFMSFRGTVTAAYFGTPRARRWAGFLSLDAYFGDHGTAEGFIPRKPYGAMLVQEIVSHPAKYPSLHVPAINELGRGRGGRFSANATPVTEADNIEGLLATNFMSQFERRVLSFAEDKALREATRELALANGTGIFDSGKVMLPNKLPLALNPDEDADLASKRNKWLLEELEKPGVHAAATKPATRGGRGGI